MILTNKKAAYIAKFAAICLVRLVTYVITSKQWFIRNTSEIFGQMQETHYLVVFVQEIDFSILQANKKWLFNLRS